MAARSSAAAPYETEARPTNPYKDRFSCKGPFRSQVRKLSLHTAFPLHNVAVNLPISRTTAVDEAGIDPVCRRSFLTRDFRRSRALVTA
jgi:hypothetical protein